MLWFLIWLPILGPSNELALANFCYSCAGTCDTVDVPCNCQMGSCSSEYCFTEKKTDSFGVLKLVKGCIKGPPRRTGCDYNRHKDAVYCICTGPFCNGAIQMKQYLRRNITCKHCSEKDPACDETCVGEWCYESTNGQTGCGFGPPSLPFFYENQELLGHRSKVCMTVSRGNGIPARHCICNTYLCNDAFHSHFLPTHQRSRSIYYTDVRPQYHKCVSCDVATHDSSVTTSCRQNSCYGHYCSYTTQRFLISGPNQRSLSPTISHERQGCINVTNHRNIKIGCTHKWTSNEEELICLCAGTNCNIDINSANVSVAQQCPQLELITYCLLFLLLNCLSLLPHNQSANRFLPRVHNKLL